MVRQYTEEYYLSAAANYSARAAHHGWLGLDLLKWQAELSMHWSALRFGSAAVDRQGEQYFFQVQVYLGGIDPEAVQVELYAEGQSGGAPVRQPTNRGERLVDSANDFIYTVRVPATRPPSDYTPRLIPHYRGAIRTTGGLFYPVARLARLAMNEGWHERESPTWRTTKQLEFVVSYR